MAQDFERYLEQDINSVGSPTVLRTAAILMMQSLVLDVQTLLVLQLMFLSMLKMEVTHILLLKMHLSLQVVL